MYHSWKRRTNVECRSQAAEYEATSDEEARASQFEKYGIRWSELLRLPYFDIVRCVVVDAMHNLFLGLIKEHLTGILGISLQSRKPEAPAISISFSEPPSDFTTKEKQSLKKLHQWLSAPMSLLLIEDRNKAMKKLKGAHAKALEFACTEIGCAPATQASWKNRGIFPRKNTKSLALTTLSSVFLRSRSETGTTSDSRAKGKTGGSGTKLSQIPVPSR